MNNATKTSVKGLSSRAHLKILRGFGGPMFAHMARTGQLQEKHLKDRLTLCKFVEKTILPSIENIQINISIHEQFIQQADECWKKGQKHIAIVLLAVALEHLINSFFRDTLGDRYLNDSEITTVIKSTNIDAKLSWLLPLAHCKPLPTKLKNRIKKIFDIRNSIVHYKWMSSLINDDDGGGSYGQIEKEIRKLGKFSVRICYRSVDAFLEKQLSTLQPWRWLATRAYYLFFDDYDPGAKKSK